MNVQWLTLVSVMFAKIFGDGQFGTLFYLSLPNIPWMEREESGVTLFISKIVRDSIEVELTIPHCKSKNGSVEVIIEISKRQIETFPIANRFLNLLNEAGKPKYCFKFQSDDNFALSVVVKMTHRNMDAFQLIPFDSWGRFYFVFTLGLHDTIIIVAPVAGNRLTIRANVASAKILEEISNNPKYLVYDMSRVPTIKWNVAKNDTFFCLSGCSSLGYGSISLSGTKVFASLPIGVFTGSCLINVTSFKCQNETNYKTLLDGDITQEMILPADTYGKHFIVFYTSGRQSPSKVAVQAIVEKTIVKRYTGQKWASSALVYTLKKPGDVIEIKDVTHPYIIKSNYPVQVFYILSPSCGTKMLGDISQVTILPTALFYNVYYWGVDINLNVHYSAIVVARSWSIFYLLLNNKPMSDHLKEGYKFGDVHGSENWKVFELFLIQRYHTLTADDRTVFGCYLYGVGKQIGIIQFIGFYKGKPCIERNSVSGDLVDNDCDFEIDEDEINGQDDDNDSAIDEDARILLKSPFYADSDTIIAEDETSVWSLAFDTFLWLIFCVVSLVLLSSMVSHKRSARTVGLF